MMTRKLFMLMQVGLVFFLGACAGIPKATKGTADDHKAPIIDRELFFADPKISEAKLSPDGLYIAFTKPYRDMHNIWIKGIHQGFDQAKPITYNQRPVSEYYWSRDSKYLLYVLDKGGNENFHVYVVDPQKKPDPETGVPPTKNLTDIKGVRAEIYSLPKSRPGEIVVGMNDRDPYYDDVYRMDIVTGKRELLIKNTQNLSSYICDLDGNVRLAMRLSEEVDTEVLRVDGDKLTKIYDCIFGDTCNPIRFHKDGQGCYLLTNRGEGLDRTRLGLLNLETGIVELVDSDPEEQVDFERAIFSEASDDLIGTVYNGDRVRIYPKSEQMRRDLQFFKEKLPEGELSISSMTHDMKLMLIDVESDVDPGSTYLFDRENAQIRLLYRSRPELPSHDLAHVKPVRYKARDGLMIPAYLTLPKRNKSKNLPTVIIPHGGPWSRFFWGYNPYVQFFANRGYAVFQPNFRGSIGYGKKFANAGNRQWGKGTMQHDVTDGVKWLIAEGISDPKRVGVFGCSYGGYATLAGSAFTPELYACGVPCVAPSNLISLLESMPTYWKSGAKMIIKRVGDPGNEEGRKFLKSISPLHFVDQIKIPLLVIQGANDPRVKRAEADQIVVALHKKKHAVEYLLAPNEGHGFHSQENKLAMAAAMEKFFAKHIGGRYQKEIRPKIKERLSILTVDPATVKLPSELKKELLAKAETAKLPEADGSLLEENSMQYKIQMNLGEVNQDAILDRVLKRVSSGGVMRFRVINTTTLPQGKQIDMIEMNHKTLQTLSRSVYGPEKIKIRYADKLVICEINTEGTSVSIKKDLKAPVLADGCGLEMIIAGLPLDKDYSTTLRLFETKTQKVRLMKLEVLGKETTRATAGNFQTWILSLKPLDDEIGGSGMLRVMQKAPHHVVKSEYKLPTGLGGGTTSYDLVKLNNER